MRTVPLGSVHENVVTMSMDARARHVLAGTAVRRQRDVVISVNRVDRKTQTAYVRGVTTAVTPPRMIRPPRTATTA